MSAMTSVKSMLCANTCFYQRTCVLQFPGIHSKIFCYPSQRNFSKSHCHNIGLKKDIALKNEGIFKAAKEKIQFYLFDRWRYKARGYFLYESIADRIPYFTFFEEMKMPDTFNSWFLITELHVWMLLVKSMEYGSNGRTIRNFIVEAMWADVSMKGKKLGIENVSMAQKEVIVMGDQFQAALISYDEGLLTDDRVLASAVWRRFFDRNCDGAKNLEIMVKYIRRQLQYLDSLSGEDFVECKINWIPLVDVKSA